MSPVACATRLVIKAAGKAVLQTEAEKIAVFLLRLEGMKEQKVAAVLPKVCTVWGSISPYIPTLQTELALY